jgi:hypothetical protein
MQSLVRNLRYLFLFIKYVFLAIAFISLVNAQTKHMKSLIGKCIPTYSIAMISLKTLYPKGIRTRVCFF